MAELSIISEEDEEEQEPLAAAPKPGLLSIVDEADEPEIQAPPPAAIPKPEPLSIVAETEDIASPVSRIDIGSDEEPGFLTRAFDSFQAWRDETKAEMKRNAPTREERQQITKDNIKLNRELFSNKGGGQFSFGSSRPAPHSALVRAGLEEPPENEVENALNDYLRPNADTPGRPSPEGRLKKEREQWARYPKDQAGFLIDPTRPIVQNPDGSSSSELSITIDADGRWFNIPSMVNGKQVSQEEAIESARSWAKKGWIHPNFATQEEAVAAAGARSDYLPTAREEWANRKPDEPKEPREEKPEDPWGLVLWDTLTNVPAGFKRQYGGAKMFLNAPRDLAYILEAASDQGVAPEDSFALEVEAYVQGKEPAEYYGEMLKEAENNADLQEGLRIHQEATQYLQNYQPNVREDSAKYYAGAIIEGAINMSPMLITTAVTRSPTLGLAVMGGQVFADQYAESISRGRSHSEATLDGTVFAAAEMLTEKIPLGILTKGGGTLLKRFFKAGGAEAIQEPVTQLIQEAYTMGIIEDEMTFGEALVEIVTTEEGRAMLRRSAIIGFGVGGTLATAVHPLYKDVVDEGDVDPDGGPGWIDLPETGPGGKPLKKMPSEMDREISKEEADELGLSEVDVDVDLLERVAAGDPLTIDEQYTLTNGKYGMFVGAEERVMLLPKGLKELKNLRERAAGEEIIMEGEEITIRRTGEAIDIAEPVEPGVVRRAQRVMEEYAKVQEAHPKAMTAMTPALKTKIDNRWSTLTPEQMDEIMTVFEEFEKLPAGDEAKLRKDLEILLKQFQEAAKGEPDEDEELVRFKRRTRRLFAGEQVTKTEHDTDRVTVPERLKDLVGPLPELQTHPLAKEPTAPKRMVSNEWGSGVRQRLRMAYPGVTDMAIETAFQEGQGIEGLLVNLRNKPASVTAVQNINAMLGAIDKLVEKYDMLRSEIVAEEDEISPMEVFRSDVVESRSSVRARLDAVQRRVEEPKSPEQAEAGNYPKGHLRVDSIPGTIETKKGGTRKGIDRKGKPWQFKMKDAYGYLKGTESREPDGRGGFDQIDAFFGPYLDSGHAVIINQKKDPAKPMSLENFDEHKIMLGYRDTEEAQEAYRRNYTDGGAQMGSVVAMTTEELREWLETANTKTPAVLSEVVFVPGRGEVDFRPFQPAIDAAQAYADANDIEYEPAKERAKIDVRRASMIAREFTRMEHDPSDPAVAAAYQAMIDETLAQYEYVLESGLEVEFVKGKDPYRSPRDAILDIRENNHLWVLPTREAFGTRAEFEAIDNPLLNETKYKISGKVALANDIFRVVHDYFGHLANGFGFRARGEENAWQHHAAMYSPLARRAMTVETRGQNSWVNYGPHGETNRTASAADTVYADQKIGLLPVWVSEEGRLSAKRPTPESRPTEGGELVAPPVSAEGRITLTHYSRRADIDRIDPSFYGQGIRGAEGQRAQAFPETWIDRTYYGISPELPGGYRKESGLGPETYETSIDARLLYDLQVDPENLAATPDLNESEAAIRDAGYSGYWLKHPSLGLVSAVFDPLEVETKKGPSARARRKTNAGRGQSVDDVQQILQKIYRMFRTVPPVRVVESIEDLPRHLQVSMEDEHSKKNTTGMYDQGAFNDDIYIIANNVSSMAEAVETLLHEVVGHFGLRQVIPPWRFDEFMDMVAKSFPKQVREAARSYELDWNDVEERRIAAEEYIAHIAQRILAGQTVSQRAREILDRIVEALQNVVRWMTGQEQMFTTGQIMSVIAQSSDFVQRPGGYQRSKRRGRLRHVSAPYFFSQVWTAFNETDTKATSVDGWYQFMKGQLKNGKIKQAELDWLGLGDAKNPGWLAEATWGQMYQLTSDHSYGRRTNFEDVEKLFPPPMFAVFKEQRELGAEIQGIAEKAKAAQQQAWEEAFPTTEKQAKKYNREAQQFKDDWKKNPENDPMQFLSVNEQRDAALMDERHEELTNQLQEFGRTKPKKIPRHIIQSYIERNGVDIEVKEPGNPEEDYGPPDWSEDYPDEEDSPEEDTWYDHWEPIESENWGSYFDTQQREVWAEHNWNPDLEADPDIPEEADMDTEELNEALGAWDGTSEEDMEEEANDKTREAIELDFYDEAREEWEKKNTKRRWYSGNYQMMTDDDGDFRIYDDQGGDLGYYSTWEEAADAAEEHYNEQTHAWASYMLKPAGKDYGVLLFRWENPDKQLFTETAHWEEDDNFVAHVRFDIRKDPDGNEVFYIDEMQSDWHQEIRDTIKAKLKEIHAEHGFDKDYDNRDGTFGGGEEYDGTPPEVMYEKARAESLDNPRLKQLHKDLAQQDFKALAKSRETIVEELKSWPMTKDMSKRLQAVLTGEYSNNSIDLLAGYRADLASRQASADTALEQQEGEIQAKVFEDHGFYHSLGEASNKLFAAYRKMRKSERGEQYNAELISREEFDQYVNQQAREYGLTTRLIYATRNTGVTAGVDFSEWMERQWAAGNAQTIDRKAINSPRVISEWDGTPQKEIEAEREETAIAQLMDETRDETDLPAGTRRQGKIYRTAQARDFSQATWTKLIEDASGDSSNWDRHNASELWKVWSSLADAMHKISAADRQPLPGRGPVPGFFDYDAPRGLQTTVRAQILSFDENIGKYQRYADGQSFAPFEKDWQLLVIKHMIAEAARRGMPRIYFSKGEVHGVRWSGAESVESLEFVKHPIPEVEQDPTPDLFTGEITPVKRGDAFTIDLLVPGANQLDMKTTNKQLRKNVGDRVARLILGSEKDRGTIRAEDAGLRGILVPRGSSRTLSGSRTTYNEVAVNSINKFLKKFKGKVKDVWVPGDNSQSSRDEAERLGVATLGQPGNEYEKWDNARLRRLTTPEIHRFIEGGLDSDLVKQGREMFDLEDRGVWGIETRAEDGFYEFNTHAGFLPGKPRAVERLHNLMRQEGEKDWGYEAWEIEITPKLEETAKKGFPLFHKRGKPKTGDTGLDNALEWARKNIGPSGPRSLERLQRQISEIINIERKQMKLEQALIDQFAGLKWAIRQTHGHELPAQMSAYKQAHFTTSMDSQMYVFLTHGIPVWETVTTAEGEGTITGIKPGSKGLLEVLEPVADKITYWGYWMAARRADRLLKEGREALFTQERVDELLKLGERFPEFQDVADAYNDWKTQFLDWASEAGVINEDTRPLWDQADYVPFYRIKSDELGGSFAKRAGMGGPGIANVAQPIKRLRGAKHPLGDILENIIVNFQHIATTTMKNKAAQLAVENLKDSGLLVPAPPTAFLKEEFIPMDELKRKLKQAGVDWEAMPTEALESMQKMWTLQRPVGDDYISVLYNGKKKWFEVREETLLRSLTAINEKKFSSVMGRFFMWPLRKVKRLGTTLITLAPDFMAANWFRDIFLAFANSRHAKFPKPWSAATGAWKAFTKSPEMVAMMAAGGAFYSGYINANDPVSTVKAMKRALRQTGFKNRILDAPWKLFHLYNDIGAASENANRIGSGYIPAMKAGAGKAEAIWEAKDLMNFAKHGDHAAVQFFVQSVMFLNARVQGLVRYGQRFTEAPGLTFAKSMMYAMAVLMIWLKNKDDDRYKALPPDDKDMYVHFWTNGKHWRLPKSFELGMIFGVGIERTFEYYYSNEDDAGKVAIDRMWWVMGEVFNILGPRFPFVPLPQAITPLYEATNNWNAFFQSPIVPEYMQDIAEVKPEIVFRPTTSPTARELARGLPKWAPATLRNPILLEHLVRGYFGTLGAYVMMMSDDLVRKSFDYPARPDLRWDKMPVARRFYTGDDPPSRTSFEEVIYQVRQNAREIERAVSQMEKLEMEDEIDAFMEQPSKYDSTFTNEQVVEASKAMKPSYNEMKRIRKEITELWEDEEMSGEEKGIELNNLLRDKLEEAKEGWLERPGSSENKEDEPPNAGAVIQFEALQDTLIDLSPEDRVDYLAEQGLDKTADLLVSLPTKPSSRLRNIMRENSV